MWEIIVAFVAGVLVASAVGEVRKMLAQETAYFAGRADGIDHILGKHDPMWRSLTSDRDRPWAGEHYAEPIDWREEYDDE